MNLYEKNRIEFQTASSHDMTSRMLYVHLYDFIIGKFIDTCVTAVWHQITASGGQRRAVVVRQFQKYAKFKKSCSWSLISFSLVLKSHKITKKLSTISQNLRTYIHTDIWTYGKKVTSKDPFRLIARDLKNEKLLTLNKRK